MQKQTYEEIFKNSFRFKYETPLKDVSTFLEAIGDYNEFSPQTAISMLRKMDSYLPRYKGNRERYKVSIGRENSPVIYLNIFACGADHDDVVGSVKDVEEVLKKIAYDIGKVDEFSIDYEKADGWGMSVTKIEIRMWWD